MSFTLLLEHYGVWCKSEWGQFKTNCPFPDHPDSSPSFSVNVDSMLWKCHGCSRQGNQITLVSQMEEIGNAEARRRITEILGGQLEGVSQESRREVSFLPDWARAKHGGNSLLPTWVRG